MSDRHPGRVSASWIGLIGLIALVAAGCCVAALWLTPFKRFSGAEKFVTIPRGASALQIARQLQQEGIIRHWIWFLGYAKTLKHGRSLQAGEYRFDTPLSIPQVTDKLVRGLIYYREVTVPEGFSIFDIAELLEQKGIASAAAFQAAARQTRLIEDLSPRARSLEGFLFPDTYRFTRADAAQDVARHMVERFRQVYIRRIQPLLQGSAVDLDQVITLASLVEKETGVDEERELVSSVFHNRLRNRIPLQCDPTVIYAAKLEGAFHGEISQTDLESRSRYNTYVHPGLPPGPIANPGIRSIEAAVKPAITGYIYFVSNSHGRHVFSATLDQHNRAVAAYRRELKKTAQPKLGKS